MHLLCKNISKDQCKDAGLALVLVSLILALVWPQSYFLFIGIVLLVVVMTAPVLFRPFAKFWFGFSHALGAVVSRLLLSVIFYLLVTPVGLVRRVMGKDAMQLKQWKQNRDSVFQVRDHLFSGQDLDNPY